MHHRTPFQFAAAFALLSMPVFSSEQDQTHAVSEPWPFDTGQVFGRSAAIELTNDTRMDLIVLDGTTPVVLDDPTRYDAYFPLDVVADDLDVMRWAVAGGQGGLVTVGPDGLLLHWRDSGSGDMQSQEIGDSLWQGALAVRVADLDLAYRPDVLGVSSDGWSVLRRDSAGGSLWVEGAGFSLYEVIHGLELVHWDADDLPEIVLRHATHAGVYSRAGAQLASVPAAVDEPLTVLRSDGHDHEFLAFLDPTGLLVVHGPGGQVDSQHLFPDQVVGLAAADLDQDGHDELIANLSTNRLMIRRALPGPQGPSFSTYEYLDLGGYEEMESGLPRVTAPLVHDLTGDGHLDISLAFEGVQGRTHHLAIRGGDNTRLHLEDSSFVGSDAWISMEWPVLGSGNGSDEDLATDVRARAWILPSGAECVEPELVDEVLASVAGGWPVSLYLTLDPPGGVATPGESYYIEVDPVQVTGAELRRSWRGTILIAAEVGYLGGGRKGISEGGEEDDIPQPPGPFPGG